MAPTILSARFEQALVYTAILHSGQGRKGTPVPYVSHLLSVAALALENGANEDEVIAALLHDAVEDAGGAPRLEDIRCRFGQRVAEIVAGCTDTEVDENRPQRGGQIPFVPLTPQKGTVPDGSPKPPWEERKRKYIAQLAHGSDSVKLVSCADKVHNARSIVADLREQGDSIWSRFTTGKAGTLWYYRTLVETYQQHGAPKRQLNKLVRTVDEMEQLAQGKNRR
jgi:GTP pyrophosphokinase